MSPRAAQVRFYVDADILGLGKILGSLRNDVTYPGDPGAVIHKRHREPCRIARCPFTGCRELGSTDGGKW
jgi:hypothetical protein